MPEFHSISGVPINDIRIIGTVTLVLVLALAIVGMDWVTRVSTKILTELVSHQKLQGFL